MTFSASPEAIPADGKTQTTLSARFYDSSGQPVPEDREVIFYASRGSFKHGLGKFSASLSDSSGRVSVSLISSTIKENSQVICYSQGVWQQITVSFGGNVEKKAAFLFLSTSKTAIKTNATDTATITASVLDVNKVPIEGAEVDFLTSGGQISTSNATTDASGNATLDLSSGPDKTNQTVTITAIVQDLSSSIPIQLSGSTVAMEIASTSIQTATDDDGTTLTVKVKDGGDVSVYNANVTISQASDSPGSVQFFPFTESSVTNAEEEATGAKSLSDVTDVNGNFKTTIKGQKAGTVTLNITALGSTKSQDITVSGTPFEILEPETNSISKHSEDTVTIKVKSPEGNGVKFTASMGYWDNGETFTNASPDANDEVTATFHTGSNAGTATIRVEDVEDSSIMIY